MTLRLGELKHGIAVKMREYDDYGKAIGDTE